MPNAKTFRKYYLRDTVNHIPYNHKAVQSAATFVSEVFNNSHDSTVNSDSD